ncbi:RNA helicase [Sarracenia purpurea var. burkii]
MSSTIQGKWDEESSFLQEKGEIGFIDYEDVQSVCSYNPDEEGPIVISVPFPFANGKPQFVVAGEIVSDLITIKNTTSEPVELWKVDNYHSNPKDSFTMSLMEPPSATSHWDYVQGFLVSFCLEDMVLQPGQTLNIWLCCKPKEIGLHTTAVHFDVGDDRIERVPYYRDRKKKQLVADASAENAYVVGDHPIKASNSRFKYNFQLPLYLIPKHVIEAVENKQIPNGITEGVNRGNYSLFFRTLLNMEEIKVEENMRGYDMECISFRKKGSFLTLEVPGLTERRPSLVVGDIVFAKLAFEDANNETRPYQVHSNLCTTSSYRLGLV